MSSEDLSGNNRTTPWHALTPEEALGLIGATAGGLSAREAGERLQRFGPNALPRARARGAVLRFLAQFDNLLIYVLLASATVTAFLGNAVDTAVILGVVVVNAMIGFIQEGRAERSLEAISKMIAPKASAMRDGRRVSVAAAELVPGDLLLLEAGDRVTADVRLVKTRNLRIDESMLTGESVPAEKSPQAVPVAASLGDRRSMAYSGTLIAAGQGEGVAVATGTATELGRITSLLGRVEPLTTPLVRQMNVFARQVTIAVLALSAATFAYAVLVRDYVLSDAFMAVVAMAVAAIPEGLPAVMTITLAIGVQRMASRNGIIRRLPAVETLGSVTVICSDKTGTLTKNEMTVRSVATSGGIYEVAGVGYEPHGGFNLKGRPFDPADDPVLMELARAALLCNDARLWRADAEWVVEGDPMEGALVSVGIKAGLEPGALRKESPRNDEIPFDAQHRYMATLHHGHRDDVLLYVKGAPERILDMCVEQSTSDGRAALDKAHWSRIVEMLATGGQRVLALATKPMAAGTHDLTFADAEGGLALLGLVGLIDPPREEAIAAVGECRSAGIRVKMITGDHGATASAIAAQLGLDTPGLVVTGASLDDQSDAGMRDVARRASVFGRTSPEHKLRIVEALQANGDVVAMTGDGVNDAPALKRADVGVAMGKKGTEAAKEASEMVLADDNFASIVAAVREGRTVYDNLTKVIRWTLPTSVGETLTIVAAILLGLTLPVTPVQILWINMVTAVGLGLVLAFEPTEPDVMRRPPRSRDEPILSGELVWQTAFVSMLFVIGAFGMFSWAERRGLSHEEARTIVVNAIVVMEIFYLFSVRYLRTTALTWRGVLGTPAVLIGVGGIVALQLAFTYAPSVQRLFGTRSVSLGDGLSIVGLGVFLFLVLEVEKRVRSNITRRRVAIS
ncbi:MAG TPA: cation-transporting P-type ATPase [Hyphomicrobiaceae bacterium]|nr:cation-transporting P-type ATPase [Hyphomicrobiaceae bacterium]